MTTAREIIRKALQRGGIVTQNETPSADETSDGLDMLNDMFSSWSNDSLTVYARKWENFPLTGADGVYTIGTGQDFNTVRPTYIADAYLRDNTTDTPVRVISEEAYYAISQKNTQSIPYWLTYDNGFPVGTIRLYPVPSTAYTLFLLSEKPFSEFDLDDELDFPPGWQRAIIYNLAVELCSEYGQPVPDKVGQIARESLGVIKLNVLRNRSMDWQQGGGVQNIYTGWVYR